MMREPTRSTPNREMDASPSTTATTKASTAPPSDSCRVIQMPSQSLGHQVVRVSTRSPTDCRQLVDSASSTVGRSPAQSISVVTSSGGRSASVNPNGPRTRSYSAGSPTILASSSL